MPDVIDELRATFARDMEAAKAKQSLVEVLAYCKSSLEAQGFSPTFVDEDGMLILSVDPDQLELAPLALPAPMYVGIDLARPEPEAEELASPPPPEPEPAPAEVPAEDAKPAYKSGPWTASEEGLALRMDEAGRSTSEIAAALQRAVPAVFNKVKFLKKEESERTAERNRQASESPVLAESEQRPSEDPATEGASQPSSGFDLYVQLDQLKIPEHTHERRLRAIGYPSPWTPAADLALIEGLTAGRKLPTVATQLGIDQELVRKRFKALLPEPSWDAQTHLVAVLRARAAKAA